MGITAEAVAKQWQISREQQGGCIDSHQKAIAAQQQGWFKNEVQMTCLIPSRRTSGIRHIYRNKP